MRPDLQNLSTKAPETFIKEEIKEQTELLLKKLQKLQHLLYAESKHSLLIIIQGLDASGKDGAIKKVFSGVNPQGCSVKSFKAPTPEELNHDFLWRIHKHTPEKGMIQIFNRSHYEDVLIVRVHKWITENEAIRRFDHINAFEKLLADSGCILLKFYLHISKEEQTSRLKERMHDPEKEWKYNENDFTEASYFNSYLNAYADAIYHCSEALPWTIVPADQNWYKEFMIAGKIVSTLESLNMKYPDKVK
jgi:PPK2 family polyphosphate:nucleotide phosphotransferase